MSQLLVVPWISRENLSSKCLLFYIQTWISVIPTSYRCLKVQIIIVYSSHSQYLWYRLPNKVPNECREFRKALKQKKLHALRNSILGFAAGFTNSSHMHKDIVDNTSTCTAQESDPRHWVVRVCDCRYQSAIRAEFIIWFPLTTYFNNYWNQTLTIGTKSISSTTAKVGTLLVGP